VMYRVAELEGALLDAAVAKADGACLVDSDHWRWPAGTRLRLHGWAPSADWGQGGPIIERERITCLAVTNLHWTAHVRACITCGEVGEDDGYGEGMTSLVAAMRAYVASRYGDEVELP
jgi:hypothetical protein